MNIKYLELMLQVFLPVLDKVFKYRNEIIVKENKTKTKMYRGRGERRERTL